MLETFVFVSGYVWAYQHFKKGTVESFRQLVHKKFRRLIVPSLLFGCLYQVMWGGNSYKSVLAVINGAGHLWFLPMLFWCFVWGFLLRRLQWKEHIKILLLVVLAVFSYLPLPFQLARSMYYVVFFYTGYLCYQHRNKIIELVTGRKMIVFWLLFFVLFIGLSTLDSHLKEAEAEEEMTNLLSLCSLHSVRRLIQLVYSTIGVCAAMATAYRYTYSHSPNNAIIKTGSCCFGVYIFQQFILMQLYYQTSLSLIVSPYALPWLGFVVALFTSLLLVYLCRLTKVGRLIL